VPQLPLISGKDAVKAFKRAGWQIKRQRGSHIIMTKKGLIATLSIPDHETLDRGTLRALIRRAEMTVDEFVDLLD